MQRVGLGRTVIVQPSFYGTDNRCMLDSLARLGGTGRGVAVVDRAVDDAQLRSLHDAGVRGLRVNVESAGVRDVQAVEAPLRYWAARIADLGWHLQVYASHHAIAALAPALADLPVAIVLDHFAMVPADVSPDDAQLRLLLGLMEGENVYLKLSAPYRIAQVEPVASATDLAHRFLRANPRQILWGSDWPHTNREVGRASHEVSRYREFPSAWLIDSIHQWLPSCALRQQILVDNPARVYGFAS